MKPRDVTAKEALFVTISFILHSAKANPEGKSQASQSEKREQESRLTQLVLVPKTG